MTTKPEALEAAVDAAAALIGLPLAAEHRPGVLRFFALAAGMAEVVMAVPTTREDESGEVWRPVEPEESDG
jgi:hypothetical protein